MHSSCSIIKSGFQAMKIAPFALYIVTLYIIQRKPQTIQYFFTPVWCYFLPIETILIWSIIVKTTKCTWDLYPSIFQPCIQDRVSGGGGQGLMPIPGSIQHKGRDTQDGYTDSRTLWARPLTAGRHIWNMDWTFLDKTPGMFVSLTLWRLKSVP